MSVSESLSHSAYTEDQSSEIHSSLSCLRMYVAASIHGAWHLLSNLSGASKTKKSSCLRGKSVLNSSRIVGTFAVFTKEGQERSLSIMDTYQA